MDCSRKAKALCAMGLAVLLLAGCGRTAAPAEPEASDVPDRKSTRLNSSHTS